MNAGHNDLLQICNDALDIVDPGIGPGRIPGAAVGIITHDGKRATASRGYARIDPSPVELQPDTWFDLASLTKVMFTTPLVLKLVRDKVISLDDPLSVLIPDLHQYDKSDPIRDLTFRQCLSHNTFLPAVVPIYTQGNDPETLKAWVLQHDWPHGEPVYSDINYILLGIAIERATGKKLNEQPLEDGLSFSPPLANTAATENCIWRGRVMQGEVHDENAYALGGIAGHAGLFGTVDGVLDFAYRMLNADIGLPKDNKLFQQMFLRQHANRTIGWEIAHDNWHGGDKCDVTTIGHTGFTGTGLWINIERGYAWTLLTNRVHPSRHVDTGIIERRRSIGNLVAKELNERDDMQHRKCHFGNFCPICGVDDGYPPWDKDGKSPTFFICDSCDVEFGIEDFGFKTNSRSRNRWLRRRAHILRSSPERMEKLRKQLSNILRTAEVERCIKLVKEH